MSIAKAEGNATLDQKRMMLRRLLAERFKLSVHTEARDLADVCDGDGQERWKLGSPTSPHEGRVRVG